MRMKIRRLKRKLGVSTVVANMLMILITLSLAAILVAWAGTTFGAFSGGSSLFFQQRGQAMQERFVVENIYFDKPAGIIRVFVRNVGALQIYIAAAYLNGNPLSLTATSGTVTSSFTTAITSTVTTTIIATPTSTATLTMTQSFSGVDTLGPTCGVGPTRTATLVVGDVCEFRITASWSSGQVFTVVIASSRGDQVTYTASAP
jgi:hypothetical protein